MSQVSGLSSKKRKVDEAEVHLMKQLSDNDNDIRSYWPKASLKIPFIVGAWCPC